MFKDMKAAIFDLDGVIVDTAKYHYLAWRKLANTLGYDFSEADNEQLKGVNRMQSLQIILDMGNIKMDEEGMIKLARMKNEWYVNYVCEMDANEILPGARRFIEQQKEEGLLVALGSASKNAPMILERVGLTDLFDAIIDGNKVSASKPDPEVFLKGAQELGVEPQFCMVFEDSRSGIEAARRAGMYAIGIGSSLDLPDADLVTPGLHKLLSPGIYQPIG